MLDIPLPIWVAAFGVLFGATVSALVSKIRADRATIAEATEIKEDGTPPTLKEARTIVGSNATLKRAVQALQVCNEGLEAEIQTLKDQFSAAQEKAKLDLETALARITSLEGIIQDLTTIRDIKRRRVALANRDAKS